MPVITEYICDNCGHSQLMTEAMWSVGVTIKPYNTYDISQQTLISKIWCTKCTDNVHLTPSPPDEIKKVSRE